jgi:hypothetical protein
LDVTLAAPPVPLFALTRFDKTLWAEVNALSKFETVFTRVSTLVAAADAVLAWASATDAA